MDKKIIYGAAGLLCLAAVFPLPYGFYIFLRLAVTAAGPCDKKEEHEQDVA